MEDVDSHTCIECTTACSEAIEMFHKPQAFASGKQVLLNFTEGSFNNW